MSANSKKNSTFIVVGIIAILGLVLMFQWVLNDDEYTINLQNFRKSHQEMLKTEVDSPVPDSLKAQFSGLNYFPVDKAWRVTSKFKKNPEFEYFKMPQTDGTGEVYIIAGWCEFKYQNKSYKLTAYQPNPKDSKSFFVPFRDASTGKQSYGGGRYLDTRLTDDIVVLDFNRAYNPYCVYDYYGYACPVPPEENRLPFAVTAGEKDFRWAE